jgi:hypothetical protein
MYILPSGINVGISYGHDERSDGRRLLMYDGPDFDKWE